MVTKRKTLPTRYAKIPDWVEDLETFRKWTDLPSFPEIGRIEFYDGEVHFDMTKEQLFTHAYLKTVFASIIHGYARSMKLGRYWVDGAYISNTQADISNVPDGVFVSNESIKSEKVRLVSGRVSGSVELEGSPDMALEIVSTRSVRKDKERLTELYWIAGISEYWLVDARDDRLEFDILRHGTQGYVPTRKVGGWMKSNVFGKAFRLLRSVAEDGQPEFSLELK